MALAATSHFMSLLGACSRFIVAQGGRWKAADLGQIGGSIPSSEVTEHAAGGGPAYRVAYCDCCVLA